MPEFLLDIDKDEYESAGSKRITTNPLTMANVGELHTRKVECGMLDWDTPGQSLLIPVVIIDGIDKDKKDKLSFGVSKDGIWKGKAVYKNISGKEMPFKKGADGKQHPVPNTDDINGKEAVGVWTIMKGTKGGVAGADTVVYPKLTDIQPKGYTIVQSKDLGI